jgi:transposase-like protein
VRKLRWKNGYYCPFCDSNKLRKRGKHSHHEGCQRYECLKCNRRFDDVTGTIFSGRHQSAAVWVVYIYLMGLNVSNAQIAQELGLCESDSQKMSETIRSEVVALKPEIKLSNTLSLMKFTLLRVTKVSLMRFKIVSRAEIGSKEREDAAHWKPKSHLFSE